MFLFSSKRGMIFAHFAEFYPKRHFETLFYICQTGCFSAVRCCCSRCCFLLLFAYLQTDKKANPHPQPSSEALGLAQNNIRSLDKKKVWKLIMNLQTIKQCRTSNLKSPHCLLCFSFVY